MAKEVLDDGNISTSYIGERFEVISNIPDLQHLNAKQISSIITLMAEEFELGCKEGQKNKEHFLSPTITISSSNEGEIKRMVQKALNESYEMLEKTYGDKK